MNKCDKKNFDRGLVHKESFTDVADADDNLMIVVEARHRNRDSSSSRNSFVPTPK
jgi:hypothetical protein